MLCAPWFHVVFFPFLPHPSCVFPFIFHSMRVSGGGGGKLELERNIVVSRAHILNVRLSIKTMSMPPPPSRSGSAGTGTAASPASNSERRKARNCARDPARIRHMRLNDIIFIFSLPAGHSSVVIVVVVVRDVLVPSPRNGRLPDAFEGRLLPTGLCGFFLLLVVVGSERTCCTPEWCVLELLLLLLKYVIYSMRPCAISQQRSVRDYPFH